MSEQETNGTEEAPVVHEYSPEELGDVANEGTDTEALEVTLLGRIVWLMEGNAEVTGYVANEGAEWVVEPPKVIPHGEPVEFDIKDLITMGGEMTGTIHIDGDINLYFDVNGEDNAVHSSAPLGPIIREQITHGPHAMVEWVISARPEE